MQEVLGETAFFANFRSHLRAVSRHSQHESQPGIRTGPQRNHYFSTCWDSDLSLLMESQHHKLEEALHETTNVVVSLHIKCRKLLAKLHFSQRLEATWKQSPESLNMSLNMKYAQGLSETTIFQHVETQTNPFWWSLNIINWRKPYTKPQIL